MAEISMNDVIGQLVDVLDETFIYKPKSWTYFTDNKPDAGFLGLLAQVNAGDASRPLGGTSIAAHVHHVSFSLAESAAWIRGERLQVNWDESWRISAVNDSAWSHMLEELRSRYLDLRRAIESHGASSIEAIGGAVGVVAHMGFHLGAIRQKAAMVKNH